MRRAATAIAVYLLFALSALAPGAVADPYEDTPDAAAREPD